MDVKYYLYKEGSSRALYWRSSTRSWTRSNYDSVDQIQKQNASMRITAMVIDNPLELQVQISLGLIPERIADIYDSNDGYTYWLVRIEQ